jgi:hypothetical protein
VVTKLEGGDNQQNLAARTERCHYIYQWPYDFTAPDFAQSTLESAALEPAALESAAAVSNTLIKQLIGPRNS